MNQFCWQSDRRPGRRRNMPTTSTSFISTVRPYAHTKASRKRSFISTVRPTVHANPSRKRNFISTVRPTVHTNSSRKQSFVSTVRPTVHTNPARKRRFSKTLSKPKEFENASFSLSCGRIGSIPGSITSRCSGKEPALLPRAEHVLKTELYGNDGVTIIM